MVPVENLSTDSPPPIPSAAAPRAADGRVARERRVAKHETRKGMHVQVAANRNGKPGRLSDGQQPSWPPGDLTPHSVRLAQVEPGGFSAVTPYDTTISV